MTKDVLRRQYLQKRLDLSPAEFMQLQNRLIEQLQTLNWYSYDMAHIFLPIAKFREINTHAIISWFELHYPNLKFCVPVADLKSGEMSHILLNSKANQLSENKWGILEPQYGEPVPINKIDLVFVPLLAFDRQGYRVGYGKGFYDRFLALCSPDVKKYGLSFFDPVEKITDSNDEWDVRLNGCICSEKIWLF